MSLLDKMDKAFDNSVLHAERYGMTYYVRSYCVEAYNGQYEIMNENGTTLYRTKQPKRVIDFIIGTA